jgi:hypothetical protein
MANGLDACVPPASLPPHISGWSSGPAPPPPGGSVYSSPPPHLQLSTPDSSPQMFHHYPPQLPCDLPPPPAVSTQLQVPASLPPVRDLFFCGSSLEDSPISSPGDLEREASTSSAATAFPAMGDQSKLGFTRSCSPLSHLGISRSSFDSQSSSGEEDPSAVAHPSHHPGKLVPDGIKMPQSESSFTATQ